MVLGLLVDRFQMLWCRNNNRDLFYLLDKVEAFVLVLEVGQWLLRLGAGILTISILGYLRKFDFKFAWNFQHVDKGLG